MKSVNVNRACTNFTFLGIETSSLIGSKSEHGPITIEFAGDPKLVLSYPGLTRTVSRIHRRAHKLQERQPALLIAQ